MKRQAERFNYFNYTKRRKTMDEIKSVLLEILEETRPDVDFEGEEALIDDKILGSFDIISIVSEINDEFDIKVKATDLVPENFNTVDAMWTSITLRAYYRLKSRALRDEE